MKDLFKAYYGAIFLCALPFILMYYLIKWMVVTSYDFFLYLRSKFSNEENEENVESYSNDLETIDGMKGRESVFFYSDLRSKNGFSDIEVTPGSGDTIFSFEDDDKEEATKKLCAKLKSNIVVISDFWDEMHLTFKYNLVSSYTLLNLNFEIKNTSGVPWHDNDGRIIVKANVYDSMGNLLCIEDTSIEDSELARNRYTDYLYFNFDDVKEAARIEIDSYRED